MNEKPSVDRGRGQIKTQQPMTQNQPPPQQQQQAPHKSARAKTKPPFSNGNGHKPISSAVASSVAKTVTVVKTTTSSADKAVVKTTTTSADARRASKVLLADGDEEGYQDALNQLKIDALVPLIEDLADWLNTVIGKYVNCRHEFVADCSAQNFIDRNTKYSRTRRNILIF